MIVSGGNHFIKMQSCEVTNETDLDHEKPPKNEDPLVYSDVSSEINSKK